MRSSSHSKLSVFDFGRQLVQSLDLDPIYPMLYYSDLEGLQLKRWLLAYWCFYHVGTASWIVDRPDYWKAMMQAAESKEFHRSPERRHFRGQNAIDSIRFLSYSSVTRLFSPLLRCKTAVKAMWYVQSWVGFGPWISFKVVDMVERLGLAPIRFNIESVTLFDSPRIGALKVRDRIRKSIPDKEAPRWALELIISRLSGLTAPPSDNRPIGIQEAETILCKYKGYLADRYSIGEDTEALVKGLKLYTGKSKTARHLFNTGRKVLL